MKYILNDKIALRSWNLFPYGLYVYGQRYAMTVNKEEYLQLLLCDGTVELPYSPELSALVENGYCRKAKEGEMLTAWQEHRLCQNTYFPALNWAITGRCNYNCKHCFNWKCSRCKATVISSSNPICSQCKKVTQLNSCCNCAQWVSGRPNQLCPNYLNDGTTSGC